MQTPAVAQCNGRRSLLASVNQQFWLLGNHLVHQRLHGEPTRAVRADLARRGGGRGRVDLHGRTHRAGQQVLLEGALHAQKPEDRLVHRMAHGEVRVVAADHGLALAQALGDEVAFGQLAGNAAIGLHDGMVAVERAGLLRDGRQRPTQRGKGRTVARMRVRCRHHIGPRAVDARVDGERRRIHRVLALHDAPVVVDEHQVGHRDAAEVHAQRVDPEVVRENGVARADVARDTGVEAMHREDAKACSQALLQVQALVLRAGEHRWRGPVQARAGDLQQHLGGGLLGGGGHRVAFQSAFTPLRRAASFQRTISLSI